MSGPIRTSRTSSNLTTTDNDLAIAQALANEEQELADQDYAMRMQMGHRGGPPPAVVVRGRNASPAGGVGGGSASSSNCPGNHGLQEFIVASNAQRVVCNVCDRRIRQTNAASGGERVYSCVICNYDVCQSCYNNDNNGDRSNNRGGTAIPARTAAQQQPPPSPFASLFAPPAPVASGGYSNGNGKYMEPPSPPVPSHMCQVPVILGENICVEMMVDTGAQSSVITLPLVKRLGLESRLDGREQGIANGVGQARIIGKLRNIIVELGHVEFYMDFIVLDTQDSILLLGLDQMRKYKCIVDLEHETILFGGNGGVEVKMLPPNEQQMPRRYLQSPYGNCPIS